MLRAAETWPTHRNEAFLKTSDFRFLAEQLLIEELDAGALVRALGLKRILARPLGGRPLGHLSSRKAGSVLVHPRGGLFQKPCLHASEGLGGSHDKWLRAFFLYHVPLALSKSSSSSSSQHRPLAKIFVLFLEDLDAALQPPAENVDAALQLPNTLLSQRRSLTLFVKELVVKAVQPSCSRSSQRTPWIFS